MIVTTPPWEYVTDTIVSLTYVISLLTYTHEPKTINSKSNNTLIKVIPVNANDNNIPNSMDSTIRQNKISTSNLNNASKQKSLEFLSKR